MLEEVNGLIESALEERLTEEVMRKAREGGWKNSGGVQLCYEGRKVSGVLDIQSSPILRLNFDERDEEAVAKAYDILFNLGGLMEDI